MANALLARWEQNAKHRAVNRLFESATSSEPGANGPGVFPQPDVGPGGGLDYAQYNQSVPTKSMEEAVGEVVKGAKDEGRDTPNVVELLKLAAMVPSGIVQGLVNTAIMGGTAGKRAATGEMQVMDPATGHSSEDAIQSALALTGLISSGSFAGAPEGALASGATRRPMPQNPETITSAAVKYKGQVYTGRNHMEASDEAAKAHGIDENDFDHETLEDDGGFITNTGRYVDRVEANKVAAGAGQLNEGTPVDSPWTTAEDINMEKQPQPSQPAWYSHAARVVDSLPTTKAPANQWLATLKNKGVKDEELEALKLPTGNEPLTKDQLKATIEFNTPQLNEVVKKGELEPGDGVFEATRAAIADTYGEPIETVTDEAVRDAIAEHEGGTDDVDNKGITKYSQYQLPGGENYREVLVTTPPKPTFTSAEMDEYKRLTGALKDNYPLSAEQQQRFRELNQRAAASRTAPDGSLIPMDSSYRSSHWDEPNVLGHIRVNDRILPDRPITPEETMELQGLIKEFQAKKGALSPEQNARFKELSVLQQGREIKTLHAEELQSDWHQQGKKGGYSDPNYKPDVRVVPNTNPGGSPYVVEVDGQPQRGYATEAHAQAAVPQFQRDFAGKNARVPDAPFKKSWPDLLLRRLVKRAVDEGYDAISWTGGEAQAERYDLSKTFNDIRAYYESDKDGGTYALWGRRTDAALPVKLAGGVAAAKLDEVVGKDLADKIRKDPLHIDGEKTYSGVDLKVGGEGMKAFYDQELPRRAKKLFGGQVEKKALGNGTPGPKSPITDLKMDRGGGPYKVGDVWITKGFYPNQDKWTVWDGTPDAGKVAANGFDTPETARDWIDKQSGPTVHVMRLTPEIKAKVKAGQPLFSTGVPLDAGNDQNTKRVIRLVRVPHDPFEGEKK